MAMVKCPVCQGHISAEATTCPQCGHPMKDYMNEYCKELNELECEFNYYKNMKKPEENMGDKGGVLFMAVLFGIGSIIMGNIYNISRTSSVGSFERTYLTPIFGLLLIAGILVTLFLVLMFVILAKDDSKTYAKKMEEYEQRDAKIKELEIRINEWKKKKFL